LKLKVSIITVVYNNRHTISEAIDSVLSQTYNNIEYIIIDGDSNDGTTDIIDSYKDKISIVISETDNGIYDAMNKGINLATGDIIGILNSDDIYYSNDVIDNIIKDFIIDPDLDIVYGNIVYVDKFDTSRIVRKWVSCNYYNNFFEDAHVPPHPSLFLKKTIYSEAGLFNLNYKLAADYEFMLRIFKKFNYKSKYLNNFFVKMRLGGATNKNFKNIYKGNLEIMQSWKENLIKMPLMLIPKRVLKRLLQFI
jgi:glycosyltransferase involved in cell wall biosynthesis